MGKIKEWVFCTIGEKDCYLKHGDIFRFLTHILVLVFLSFQLHCTQTLSLISSFQLSISSFNLSLGTLISQTGAFAIKQLLYN